MCIKMYLFFYTVNLCIPLSWGYRCRIMPSLLDHLNNNNRASFEKASELKHNIMIFIFSSEKEKRRKKKKTSLHWHFMMTPHDKKKIKYSILFENIPPKYLYLQGFKAKHVLGNKIIHRQTFRFRLVFNEHISVK